MLEALSRAKAVGVTGGIVEEAEVLLIESRIHAPVAEKQPGAVRRGSLAATRCSACGITFFGEKALAEHMCFAAAVPVGTSQQPPEAKEVAAAMTSSGCWDSRKAHPSAAPAAVSDAAQVDSPAAAGGGSEAEGGALLGLLADYGSSTDDAEP